MERDSRSTASSRSVLGAPPASRSAFDAPSLNCVGLHLSFPPQYVEMYLSAHAEAAADAGAEVPKTSVIFEQISDRWEVAFALSTEGQFSQVSFVNSISTIKGGTHVEAVATQLSDKLSVPIALPSLFTGPAR